MPEIQAYIDKERLGYYDEKLKTWVEDKYTEITNDEYEALSEAEKHNGVFYYITDLPRVKREKI